MTLTISVRDYRGLERADVVIAPIALVAGRNEQGKSCLAQAARAALTGVAIPIPGVAKKDSKLLVRDGAEKGSATASNGEGLQCIEWPQCDVKGDGDNPRCSDFAVGLRHLFDLDDRERPNVLARYIDSAPTEADLSAAMTDAGYAEQSISRAWQSIGTEGWDGTYKKAREYSANLKGQWEATTGEKYGSKKAEGWKPAGWTDANAKTLAAAVADREAELETVIGQQAVGKAELDRLQALADTGQQAEKDVKAIEKLIAKLEKDHGKLLKEVEAAKEVQALAAQALEALPHPGQAEATVPCPACKAEVVPVSKTEIRLPSPAPSSEENFSRQVAIDDAQEAVDHATDTLSLAQERAQAMKSSLDEGKADISRHQQKLERAQQAAQQLADANTEGSSEEDVLARREALAGAQCALKAFDDKDKADEIHANLIKNEAMIAILAPDGLRRRKLATGLEAFNGKLADLCAAAKWPTVRLDETLKPHYGTRPLWSASASGQWRARLVAQVAMAMMDGSAAAVIDEADILDAKGRNGLMALLQAAGVKALVCLTINKPELVPDLGKAGIGESYWIEGGIAGAIGTDTMKNLKMGGV